MPTRPGKGLGHCSRFELTSHLGKSQKTRHLVSPGNYNRTWVPFPLTMRTRAEVRKGLRDTSSTVASAVEQAPPHGPLGHQHTLSLSPTTDRAPTGPGEGLGHCSHFEPTSHLGKSQKTRHLVGSGNSQPHMGTLSPHNALVRRGQRGVAGH